MQISFGDAVGEWRHISAMREFSPESVAARLRLVRKAHGLSQGGMAACVGGFTTSAYSNWEQGQSRPGIEPLVRIADHFDLTLDWLLLGRDHTLRFEVRQRLGLS